MKKLLLFICLLSLSNLVSSQAYLAWVTTKVNFREGPGKDYQIIKSLEAGAQVFIASLDAENEFYNIIDIETNKEGYVHKSFIQLGDRVDVSNEKMFVPDGKSSDYKPDVEIYNNTNLQMTLKMNNQNFVFQPQERRKISLSPERYSYRASAPGVIPYLGNESLESNMIYSWEFYIVTERR